MKSVDGIGVLEVSVPVVGAPRLIHPTLIQGGKRALLVGTGFPGGIYSADANRRIAEIARGV
jgi:hypothetical protein